MTDNQKRAHDLAVLYLQSIIKYANDSSIADTKEFVAQYLYSYDEILQELESNDETC